MTDQILGKIIDGSALTISILISVSGIWLIVRHRKNVIKLANNVEYYHSLENALIKEILVCGGTIEPTQNQKRYL
jgi:hypothetical protein